MVGGALLHMVNKNPDPDFKTYFRLSLNINKGDLSSKFNQIKLNLLFNTLLLNPIAGTVNKFYETNNGSSYLEYDARPLLHEWNTFDISLRRESFRSKSEPGNPNKISLFKSVARIVFNGKPQLPNTDSIGTNGVFYNLPRHEENMEIWLGKAPYKLVHENQDLQPGVIKDFKLDIETSGEGNFVACKKCFAR